MKGSRLLLSAAVAALAVLVACGSSNSSNGNGGSSAPTCKGATGATGAGSTGCSSCLQSNCGSQLSAVNNSCAGYVACYEGCMCSDTNCLIGCVQKVDMACSNSFMPFQNCLMQQCSSQCM